MKTKTKIVALLEIAIVLCSMFLVALPAIAAEQDDYVLGVYGNANEDDTIDMRDLTYVKLIFFGKKPDTKLSDAKYDSKINPLDFIQIKLIIVGKEKELTFVDSADRIMTVKKPVERVITLGGYDADVIRIMGAKDKIVGVSSWMPKSYAVYFPELDKLPTVGWGANLDYEAILNLNPDLVTTWPHAVTEIDEKLPQSITVACFLLYQQKILREEVLKLSYIFDKKDKVKFYLDDFYDKHIDPIKAQTEGLSEKEEPKVYVEWIEPYKAFAGASHYTQEIGIAGGKNIFADLDLSSANVDPEEVVMRNPDIIITFPSTLGPAVGYGVDDPSHAKAARDEIMNRPELADVSAVKNGRVYIMYMGIYNGPEHPIGITYFAKWLQPELFEDLDPQGIHQEFIDKFCQDLDFDVSEHGVFVYPPLEE